MGRAIFYCVQCSRRVSDSDFDSGKAFRLGERILCGDCAPPGTMPTPSSKKIPAPARKNPGASITPRSFPAPLVHPPPSSQIGARIRRLLIVGGVAIAIVVGIVAFLNLRRDAPTPLPVEPVRPPIVKTPEAPAVQPAVTPPVRPPESKEASARADLEKARAFAKASPEDLSGQLRGLTDVVWKWEGTEAAREAAKDAAAVKASILEKVSAWMADLELQIKDLLEAKQYAAAEKKIEELKKAHDLPEWRLAAERRASEIFTLAKKAGDGEGAKKPPPWTPAAKPRSGEARSYQAKWEAAAAKATARDFGSAIVDLEQSAAALKDPAVKQDLESDVALFRKVAAVQKEAMDYLTQRTRGSGITLGFRDG